MELKLYIEKEIIPRYLGFDAAHGPEHVRSVIERSLALGRIYGLDQDMLYAAAACHDLGRKYGKKDHHINSGIIIRNDSTLGKWFDPAQIELIAQAAEDHRASRKAEPRSIYGKIVAEADRLIDTDTVIRRTILYGMSQYPELAPTEQIDRTLKHLYEKYGDGGYLRLWIPWSDNALRLLELRSLLADHNAAREEVVRIFRDITKNGISGD